MNLGTLWQRFCNELSDDFTYNVRFHEHDMQIRERIAHNQALSDLESH